MHMMIRVTRHLYTKEILICTEHKWLSNCISENSWALIIFFHIVLMSRYKHKTKEILTGITTNTVIQVMHNNDQTLYIYALIRLR
jgi:hypothetical protein